MNNPSYNDRYIIKSGASIFSNLGSNFLFTIDVFLKLGPPPTCTSGRKRRGNSELGQTGLWGRTRRQTSGLNSTAEDSDENFAYATMFKLETASNDDIEIHSGIMVKPKESQPVDEISGKSESTLATFSSKTIPLSLHVFYLFLLFAC